MPLAAMTIAGCLEATRSIDSRGDATVFLTRPISLTLLILAVLAFVVAVLPTIRRKREVVFQGEDD